MTTATSASTAQPVKTAAGYSLGGLVVRVVAFEDEGSWWAETPDYPGLTVVAATREELTGRIKPAVAFHLEESGITFDPQDFTTYIIFQPLELIA